MKKVLAFSGAVLSALFLCSQVYGSNADITRDQYLIYASSNSPLSSAGIIAAGQAGADTADFYNSVSSVVYFKTDQVNYLSAQGVLSSTSFSSQTFTDGNASTGSFTVVTPTALTSATASGNFTVLSVNNMLGLAATGYVVISSAQAGTTLTLTGTPVVTLTYGGNWGLNQNAPPAVWYSSNAALSLSQAVNTYSYNQYVATPTSAGSSNVQLSCVSSGVFCNAYTVGSSSPTAISTAAFSGGVNATTITFNGAILTAGQSFAIGNTTTTAASIASALNVYWGTNTVYNMVLSTNAGASGNIVYTTAAVAGTAGNYALTTSSSGNITATNMTGGQNNAVFCANNVCLGINSTVTYSATAATLASNIATAFNASVASQTITFSAGGTVVGATSTIVGSTSTTGYVLTSSSNPALTINMMVSSTTAGAAIGQLYGGTNSAYTINSATITLPSGSNYDSTGLAVVYSTNTAGQLISPLVAGTTYFIIDLNTPNLFQLSTTSSGSLAGLGIVLVSSNSKVTADSFGLTPLAISGVPSYQWMVSDDAVNWVPFTTTLYNVAVSTAGFAAYYSSGSVKTWDLGHVDYGWMGVQVVPPTSGAVNLQIKTVGKGD